MSNLGNRTERLVNLGQKVHTSSKSPYLSAVYIAKQQHRIAFNPFIFYDMKTVTLTISVNKA